MTNTEQLEEFVQIAWNKHVAVHQKLVCIFDFYVRHQIVITSKLQALLSMIKVLTMILAANSLPSLPA